MTKDNNIKEVPKLRGRDLFSAPEAEVFEYNKTKYRVTPFGVFDLKKWNSIRDKKMALMYDFWQDNEWGNVAIDIAGIVELDSVELDEEKRIKMWNDAFEKLSDEKKAEYYTLQIRYAESENHAFSEIDYTSFFKLACSVVEVEIDGEYKPVNNAYLQYNIEYSELCFISSKIDEVNSLTGLEVLGLR